MAEDFDLEELIEDFKEFEKASYTKYKDLYEQIKADRKFIGGSQFGTDDDTILGSDIPRANLNITQNAIRTTVNSYLTNQFKWHYEGNDDLNAKQDLFLSDPDNSTGSVEALTNSVGTGLGVLVFSSDYDIDGSIKPVLYSIPDVTNVRLDPNATKLNFADATRAAIVELKSKSWIRKNYGEIDVSWSSEAPLVDISETYDRKNYAPLVTYFVKEDGLNGVTCYKLLGDRLIEDPVTLPYSYIPVVPVFGEQSWAKDNKQTWTGITTQMRPIQRLINYAYRQLLLRMSKSPKNTWISGSEAIQNFEAYYKNSDKTLNPLLMFNEYSKDGKRKLEPPQRLPNAIEFADVDQLMQNALGLTNTIIGIPATGLETTVEKTATEALLNQKTFNNNIRCYIQHLKYSLSLVGMLFAEYTYNQPMYGKIKISVVEGPDAAMEKQEARVQLQSYAPLLTSDSDKQKLVIAQCLIERDNEYVAKFLSLIQPQMTDNELQQQQLLAQADQEIKNRDAQIVELQKRLGDMETNQKIEAYGLQREMLLEDQKFNHQKELKLLDAQIKANDPAEMAKTEADIYKANASIEKEAISLQKEEMKAQNPEVTIVEEV